jgi:hypothetical protein
MGSSFIFYVFFCVWFVCCPDRARTGFIPGNKISSPSFVIVGFEKPAEGQIRMPETPSQNPAGKGENRQSIKNKENHKNNFWNESP